MITILTWTFMALVAVLLFMAVMYLLLYVLIAVLEAVIYGCAALYGLRRLRR